MRGPITGLAISEMKLMRTFTGVIFLWVLLRSGKMIRSIAEEAYAVLSPVKDSTELCTGESRYALALRSLVDLR